MAGTLRSVDTGGVRRRSPSDSFISSVASGLLGAGGWSFLVATVGVSGFNFIFHILISRLLGPAHYGALGALLSFISILAVPLGAIQLAVTQAVVSKATASRSISRVVARVGACGLLAMLAFWGLTPILDKFLALRSSTSLLLLGAWIPMALIGAVLQGALIGELRFMPVALSTFAGGGALRLVAGAGLVSAGFGLDGAVLGTLIGQAFTTATLALIARREMSPTHRDPITLRLRDTGMSIVAISGYTALTGIDTLLARHLLPPIQSGLYAAAAVAGHIAMFLPGALVMIAFPHFVSDEGAGPHSRKTLKEAFAIVVLLALLAIVILAIAPELVVRVLFGDRYLPAASIVALLGVASGFLGLAGLLTYFQLARRSYLSLLNWGGVVGASILLVAHHGSISTVAEVMTVIAVAVFLALALPTLSQLRPKLVPKPSWPPRSSDLASELDLTLVVPFYNPGSQLASHVTAILQTLQEQQLAFELIAVSDGSTDGSQETLSTIPGVRIIELACNQGKGAALRSGLAIGRGRYLGFIDGDGDIPADQLRLFVDAIRSSNPDIVLGSKLHRDSKIVYPFIRRVYSFGYQQLNRILFGLPVKDTQTGIKLIKREVLDQVLPRMLEKRFAFDLELLVISNYLGYRDFLELPVEIRQRFTSTISIGSVCRMLTDTLAIFYRLHLRKHYREYPVDYHLPSSVYLPLELVQSHAAGSEG